MKNVFIVLLVAAIGAGAYFYFGKKQKTSSSNSKELILGKWKLDSIIDSSGEANPHGLFLAPLDSGQFEFKYDTLIFQSLKGISDTNQYKFADDKNFTVWKNADTLKEKWNIAKLDSTVLILKDPDNAAFHLQRIKE